MKKYYLAILVYLLMSSCGNNNKKDIGQGTPIVIDQYYAEGVLEHIEQLGYVLFKTKGGDLLGKVNNFKIVDNKFFVKDGEMLFIFDKDGSQIAKLSARGRGPKEYVTIDSYDINPITQEIFISDYNSSKLVIFNFDGDFVRKIELDFQPFTIFHSNNMLVSNNDGREKSLPENMMGYNLSFFTPDGKFIKSELQDQTKQQITTIPSQSYYHDLDGSVLYAPFLSSVIYRISLTNVTAQYQMDYRLKGWRTLTDQDIEDYSFNIGLGKLSAHIKYEEENYIIPNGTVINNDRYLVTSFGMTQHKKGLVVFDKERKIGKAFNVSVANFNINDISSAEFERLLFRRLPNGIDGNKFYITLFDLIMLPQFFDLIKDPQLKEVLGKIVENEGLGVCYYTLKRF